MKKRLGSKPIKTLFENDTFIVRFFDNNSISINHKGMPNGFQVAVQMQDTPDEFEQKFDKGHINVSHFFTKNGKSTLDMNINGKPFKIKEEK